MVEIDGAHGEGGGQLVRTAVAIAAARHVPIRIVNIRAGREVPGLAAQHVAAVRAVALLCDARCEGLALHSTTLAFQPSRLHGGEFEVDVGTAGSITLVLQALLPAAIASRERVRITVRGGTDVRAAPALDYARLVWLPLLARLGVRTGLHVARRGYFPKGAGAVTLEMGPVPRLAPLHAELLGPVQQVEIHTHVARLPREIAERMETAARAELAPALPVAAQVEVCPAPLALGPGGAIVLRALAGQDTLGAGEVAERGVPAERLGERAARALMRDLRAQATLDVHAADQMLVFLAMAQGPSVFRASRLSSHASTAMWLLQRLTPAHFDAIPSSDAVLVRVEPASDRAGPVR